MLKQSTWSSSKSLRPFWASKYSSDVICLESFSPASLFLNYARIIIHGSDTFSVWKLAKSQYLRKPQYLQNSSIFETQQSEMTLLLKQIILSKLVSLIQWWCFLNRVTVTMFILFHGHIYSDKTFHARIGIYLSEKQKNVVSVTWLTNKHHFIKLINFERKTCIQASNPYVNIIVSSSKKFVAGFNVDWVSHLLGSVWHLTFSRA